MVAQPGHDQDEEGHPEGRPAQLGARAALAGGGEVEPLDQDQAEAVEQHGDREQEGVRVRGPEAHGEVREQRGGGQARGVVGGGAGGVAGRREADVEVAEHGDQDRAA